MLLHEVQLGPVPKYRFFCFSARDTVCPIRCDVEIVMAPGRKPSCLTTLPVKPVRTPVAILGSLGVCIYVPAGRHWLISYSPIHLT